MWALVKTKNQEIYQTNPKKYDLLKQLETKEGTSKKAIAKLKDGDIVTVVFCKQYKKSVPDGDFGRSMQKDIFEVQEACYTLKELTFKRPF